MFEATYGYISTEFEGFYLKKKKVKMERHGPYEIHTTGSNVLGKGNFGCVYKGTNTVTGDFVAAKFIKPGANLDLLTVYEEIKIMKKVKGHPTILNITDHYQIQNEDNTNFWIMTEFCGLGNLREYALMYDLHTKHMLHITIINTKSHYVYVCTIGI